jgi:hypothetical protein
MKTRISEIQKKLIMFVDKFYTIFHLASAVMGARLPFLC